MLEPATRGDGVRAVGRLVEAVHAPVYFAAEPQEEYAAVGLRGYWRGYFASRLAALGPVGPDVAVACLGGFAPAMVERALPAVWALCPPEAALDARLRGARRALHRALESAGALGAVRPALDALLPVVERMPLAGRPMAAAHRAVPEAPDDVGRLWQACTALREHRGDGHLAAVTVLGLRWPRPHRLADARVDPRQRELRGWSEQEWDDAAPPDGAERDAALAARLEELTDDAAAPAWEGVDLPTVVELLRPLARACAADVPVPNAMGLVPDGA